MLINIEDIIGVGTTNNNQIKNLMKNLFNCRFKGVFCSDDMPNLKNYEYCIVNTDNHKQSGTHWIGAYKYKNKPFVYDSFDRNVKSLSNFWRHKHNWINASSYRRESYRDKNCGQLSCTFLLVFDKYKMKCIGLI